MIMIPESKNLWNDEQTVTPQDPELDSNLHTRWWTGTDSGGFSTEEALRNVLSVGAAGETPKLSTAYQSLKTQLRQNRLQF